MLAALALQAGFVYAIVSGLAATMLTKLPEVLKVEVEQEKIAPKPPPPPPPPVDLPPPPTAPPPVINIQTETPSNPIHVEAPKPAPPPKVLASSPVSIGRAHTCLQNYPEISVRLNEEGTTTLAFKIQTDGSVTNVTVAKSSGSERLDNAAVSCAERWRYKPAIQEGNPVETNWQAAVQWKLH